MADTSLTRCIDIYNGKLPFVIFQTSKSQADRDVSMAVYLSRYIAEAIRQRATELTKEPAR